MFFFQKRDCLKLEIEDLEKAIVDAQTKDEAAAEKIKELEQSIEQLAQKAADTAKLVAKRTELLQVREIPNSGERGGDASKTTRKGGVAILPLANPLKMQAV